MRITLSLWIALIVGACALNGCGASNPLTLLTQNWEQALTGAAPQVTGPGCSAIRKSLQNSEIAPICSGLNACSAALCLPIPLPTP